jgi:hypothetical protein
VIEVSSIFDDFFIFQVKYISDLLNCVALGDDHIVETRMELNVQLCGSDDDSLSDRPIIVILLGACLSYRHSLRYILSSLYSVFALTSVYYSHLLRVLRYLHGTISRRLFFPCSNSL